MQIRFLELGQHGSSGQCGSAGSFFRRFAEIVGSRSASLIKTLNRTGRIQPEQEDGTASEQEDRKTERNSKNVRE
jgi:hypothetical protein